MFVPKATRTGEVYEALRADILNTQIEPGRRLKIADLSNRFGVSLSVVREALTRLGEQGLVVANPHVPLRGNSRNHPKRTRDKRGVITQAGVFETCCAITQ